MTKNQEYLNELIEFASYEMDKNYLEECKTSLQELVDKSTPAKLKHFHTLKQFGVCPICKESVNIRTHSNYCGKCGQRLEWVEND